MYTTTTNTTTKYTTTTYTTTTAATTTAAATTTTTKTMIPKCNSPIPSMTVWFVSSSRVKWKEGSSAANLTKPVDIFSKSALDFGSMATLMTGSGNSILSKTMGLSLSHKVSPVVVSFKPATA